MGSNESVASSLHKSLYKNSDLEKTVWGGGGMSGFYTHLVLVLDY